MRSTQLDGCDGTECNPSPVGSGGSVGADGLSRRAMMKRVAAGGAVLAGASLVPGRAMALGAFGSGGHRLEPDYDGWKGTLGEHRIAKIERREVQNRFPRLVSRNAQLGVHGWGGRDTVLILHSDKGATGWGFAPGAGVERVAELSHRYVGSGLLDVFDPAVGIAEGVPNQLDLPLHDLAGMILGVPVYEMLGGKGSRSMPCYSGMIYFDDIEPLEEHPGVEQVLFNAGADHAFGYRQMKIKVGRGNKWMPHDEGLARDIEVTRRLAEAYPDVRFLADANDGFTMDDTKAYLEGIGDVELIFMEEPFRENVDGFRELKAFLEGLGKKTYIADGESSPDEPLLDRLMDAGVLGVHLTDVYGLGFTEWRKLMPELIRRGVQSAPHTWGSRLKTVYASHLGAGLGNVLTVEGVTAFSRDIDYQDYNPGKDGLLTVPAKPGFGLTLR